LARAGRLFETRSFLNYKLYFDDFAANPIANMWTDTMGTAERHKTYVVQTATKVIERCLLMTTGPGDLVLDPTCFRAGTRVKTESGWKAIETVRPGERVWTHRGRLRRVLGVQARPHVGRMVGLRMEGSDAFVWATPEHRFLTPGPSPQTERGVSGEVCAAASLTPGPSPQTERGVSGETPCERGSSFSSPSPAAERGPGGEVTHSTIHHRLGGISPYVVKFARGLRLESTSAEKLLWECLRGRRLNGAKFRRQHPLGSNYIADFYCAEAHLALELDGSVHDSRGARWSDGIRHRQIQEAGVRVLRYRNEEVLNDLEIVLAEISAHLTSPPGPLSENGEGEKEPRPPNVASSQTPLSTGGEGPGVRWREADSLRPGNQLITDETGRVSSIAAIERVHSNETVYDLTVEEDHSFVTEAGVTHNCGSGTTGYVAEQWGRRWITVDTSRVAIALARTRLMAAKFPYYLLADSPEGAAKEADLSGMPAGFGQSPKYEDDIRKGFVYRRVPHVTLKSIANNEEIDAIHAKWQEKLEPLRARVGAYCDTPLQEWEMPREPRDSWPKEAKNLLAQWWELRGQRQKEIDASIARHAETEILYDQPYEDSKRVRVSGPFTVESLSPHRVLSADQERPASEKEAAKAPGPGQFETMILENLKKAGVQNTVKKERLTFDRLEPYAGVYLHAEGEYTENGKSRRAAVCIGPEHGTVGPELVKEAAKEAVKGIGFDLLVVCGFAFDPHVSEETKQYGKLSVLMARMNPDLAMGDELLKKTGAGNLFMVFGEPDIALKKQKDGRLAVEIKGVDVYDPTTGQIRSHSTDDIACWFIDTDYNEESFFVRHAYFCGADEPYEKLKRALRAEIDESAWSSLYSTKSRPFDPPAKGKIAIKVINHYGDEVLKVYDTAL
jgi:very-short-patch-repair endonuclease